ncbi:MAG: regulatory protein RecX [Ruminococcaceae bacterium]|nr:regulatory protein RecX [Oscillospiraceae bacterium]
MDATVKIEKITVTKKGRYALFCGGEFLFSVDEETFIKHHIKEGSVLTREELECLRAASDYFSAKNKALELLGYRDHSRKELTDKLKRKFDEETSRLAVEKMCELRLVDDREFARKLAAELIEGRGQSKRAAAQKLYEKGVAKELIEEALAEYEDDETDAIRALVEKKYMTKLADKDKRQTVFASLMRRGFKSENIKEVLREFPYKETEDEYFD